LAHLSGATAGMKKEKIKIRKWREFASAISPQGDQGANVFCPGQKLAAFAGPGYGAKGMLHGYVEHKASGLGRPVTGSASTMRHSEALVLDL
jgi:hypothetical protein